MPNTIHNSSFVIRNYSAKQALVAANRGARFERKIQATLTRVWGNNNGPLVEES